jgi:hypothetical protein
MGVTLNVGDRVRVTSRSRVKGYQPGDKGQVVDGPKTLPGRTEPYYLVVLERDGGARTVPFDADEIELDVRCEDGVQAEDMHPVSITLRVGDRVHVTAASHVQGYHPGKKGTVLRTPPPAATSVPYFIVAMDKNRPGTAGVVFAEREIEPDT